MASRRMFSLRIINSGRFMKMPVSTQCLYFHLGLHADDDGIVEAYSVISTTGCTEDDLKVLVAKGFAQVLNEDLVTYITDWNENNKIRADRKIDSIYKELLLQLNPEIKLIEKKPRADQKNRMDGQWTGNGPTMDGQWTGNGPHRLGKDRLGKVRLGKVRGDRENGASDDAPKPVKHKHGEYMNVLLTDTELEKLTAEYPDIDERIERLSSYVASTGKKYKSHYATIRNWARKDKDTQITKKNKTADMLEQSYSMIADWAEGSEGK